MADQLVKVEDGDESTPVMVSGVIADPASLVWSPGLCTSIIWTCWVPLMTPGDDTVIVGSPTWVSP